MHQAAFVFVCRFALEEHRKAGIKRQLGSLGQMTAVGSDSYV